MAEKLNLHPYLTFDGTCEEAFQIYAKTFGGTFSFRMTFGESPVASQVPKEWASKLLHATLMLGDHEIGGADAFPGAYEKPQGVSIMLNIPNPSDTDRIFVALAQGGRIKMPCEETFWALRFGEVVDRFGISWMLQSPKPS